MDTPSRMNHPSSMEMPQIGWLFDECLDNSDIVDVFDGVVLETVIVMKRWILVCQAMCIQCQG